MSLFDSFLTKCARMTETKVDDGEGGYTTTWTEGEEIDVAIVHDSSVSARVAESNGVTSTYTLTTSRDVQLSYHEVIKRLSDGKCFRVTSDWGDDVAPSISTLDMSQVSAEKWELTR